MYTPRTILMSVLYGSVWPTISCKARAIVEDIKPAWLNRSRTTLPMQQMCGRIVDYSCYFK